MRLISIVIVLVTFAAPAAGQTSVDDLRRAVFAVDIDKVEAIFEAARRAPETKRGDYSEQRELFSALAVTDPRAIALIRAWRAEKPDSPYAMTAEAWLLLRAGYWIRGSDTGQYIHPDARTLLYDLHRNAADRAIGAFKIAPDLVGASDAIFAVFNAAGIYGPITDFVDQVFKVAPNSGSLERAVIAVTPQWGGTTRKMKKLCDAHAKAVLDIPGYDADICFARAFATAGIPEKFLGRVIEITSTNNNPALDEARRKIAVLTYDLSPEMVASLREYLSDPTVTDTDVAWLMSYSKNGEPAPRTLLEVTERKVAKARADLEFDPSNPDLLLTLATTNAGEYPLAAPPSPEAIVGYMTEALTVAPYSGTHWLTLAFAKVSLTGSPGDKSADPYFQNAVVYSYFRPDLLIRYSEHLKNRFSGLASAITQGGDYTLTEDEMTPEIAEANCQIVRVARLIDSICSVPSPYCDGKGTEDDTTDYAFDNAETLGLCDEVLTADIRDLLFQPTDVGIGPSPFNQD